MNLLNQLFRIPTGDPEEARRRNLLNILLLGVGVLALLMVVVTVVARAAGLVEQEQAGTLLRGSTLGLTGAVLVYVLNRFSSGWVASSVFVVLLITITALSDDPAQVADGRSLFVFAIPILMASVLLRPYASFVAAALVSAVLVLLALAAGIVPNLIAIIAFFALALVSWLSARSLERVLAELRQANQELDQRVYQRTRDLAEALAREHSESSKNQAILEGIADGVIVFDEAGKAIVANHSVGRILDKPVDAILGRDIGALMGDDVGDADRARLIGLLGEQEAGRASAKIEWGPKTLSVSLAPVQSTAGRVSGTVAVMRDFTREAEVERTRSDFVSTVSHELRTPLTSVKGYLDLLLMGAAGATNKQQESFLRIAKDNADRLQALVSDLLDLSRIEAGKVDLDVRVISLPDVIHRVANSLEKEFSDRGLVLTTEVPANLPELFGDPDRISQVLMNLLSNAYKYTEEGGATLQVSAKNGALQIDVQDTGVGIAPEDQEHLFTPFFRAEDPVIREQTGTGLGLSITRSLIELHGGDLWVESEPGAGTTVSFTLPLPAGLVSGDAAGRGGAGLDAAAGLAPESTFQTGPWIVVADDDADLAGLFRRHLERAGYRVTLVTQGSQVVEVAEQLWPDLITLDLLMDVDGLSVLRELKARPTLADIPVVIISMVPEPEKGLALGAADYLVKPIAEADLLDCVRRVLKDTAARPRPTILVVDDEKDIVGWLKQSLSGAGYVVGEAYDGLQALEAVAVQLPDLILLDMKMPRLDGRGTLRRLRENPETSRIPVIVLSANPVDSEEERSQLVSLGVRRFLHKPVTVEQLVAEIQELLGGSQLAN
jgi:signal transduction histidine kinase/CheY-like chemotaxis protein